MKKNITKVILVFLLLFGVVGYYLAEINDKSEQGSQESPSFAGIEQNISSYYYMNKILDFDTFESKQMTDSNQNVYFNYSNGVFREIQVLGCIKYCSIPENYCDVIEKFPKKYLSYSLSSNGVTNYNIEEKNLSLLQVDVNIMNFVTDKTINFSEQMLFDDLKIFNLKKSDTGLDVKSLNNFAIGMVLPSEGIQFFKSTGLDIYPTNEYSNQILVKEDGTKASFIFLVPNSALDNNELYIGLKLIDGSKQVYSNSGFAIKLNWKE